MTTPVAHGYPDWSRLMPESDVVFFHDVAVSIGAPVTRGPFFVGASPALGFFGVPITSTLHVEVSYFADESLTLSLGSQAFDLRNNTVANFAIPVKGPWARVSITNNANPTVYTLTMYSCPVAGVFNGPNSTANLLVSNGAVPVNAGATVDVEAGALWPCEATWEASSSLATWSATLQAIDYLGVATDIDFLSQAFTIVRRQVFLPFQTVRVRLINTTGINGTIGVRLSARALLQA